MNLDDLTLGQAKQLATLFQRTATDSSLASPLLGRFVLCRCVGAGVHAGTLVALNGDCALLKDSRRLWSWKAKGGIALSGLSQLGLASGKVDTLLPDLALTGVVEVIPCSPAAAQSILDA